MQVTKATFTAFQGTSQKWVLRVEVEGSDFQRCASPVVASVGGVPVEFIIVNLASDGFGGLMRTVPPTGAELSVGYDNTGLDATGIFFDPQDVVAPTV
ncbi:hypothetical protein [Longimicrobium sp.]|uniref:hypothetical protein n=1 Tax=Longimicrobium sp. TaxID=2029185 RepID=UPI002CCFFB39|nr:hypothetical protein [Longimicrobium sp.]HSU17360.1 hypothetical protein [Longimicrobium sp.]